MDDQFIDYYFNKLMSVLTNINKKNIMVFVNLLLNTYEKGSKIYFLGNGGSASNASHFAGDLVKGLSTGLEKRFKAICLSDNVSTVTAIANDISYDDIFVVQLKNLLEENDLVVGLSGSGNSINVIKALEYAKTVGAKTVAFCGYNGGRIKEIVDLAIHAEVNDMEISEDIQLIVSHCVKRIMMKKLSIGSMGPKYDQRISK